MGCIRPTFDLRFENVILSQHLTLEILVQQINYLIDFYQNAANQHTKLPLYEINNLEKVFKMFYQFLTDYLFDKTLNSTQKNQYLTQVKQALPNNWILIASKENVSFFETKTEFLISFSNKICKQKLFFWLACNSQRPIREVLQRGKQLTLK